MAKSAERKPSGMMDGFLKSAERFPSLPALVCEKQTLTYGELHAGAATIAAAILRSEERPDPLVALLAYRSVTAYRGVLGILGAGRGYVPLSPRFPAARTRRMLFLSGCHTLIVGSECLLQLPELLQGFDRPLVVLLPDAAEAGNLPSTFRQHRFVVVSESFAAPDFPAAPAPSPDSVVYLLFTSGSTGEPKGVPITQSNLRAYIDYVSRRYDVGPQDRFSQHSDLTFDLSAHDMFLAWESGAALHPVVDRALLAPAKFIRDRQLTVWFSVPSAAGMLKKLHLLLPGSFPSLRWSLFCGEPLPASYAQGWQEAAPSSIVENLYGPTETTIAISHYRWDPARSTEECRTELCPIGWIFATQQACLSDSAGNRAKAGECGELCLSGTQVAPGYWNDPEKTRERFIKFPHSGAADWYRTGDVVAEGPDGCLHCLGRADHQIKIRGFRAELQEIEAILRRASGVEMAVAVPSRLRNGSAEGVVAFISGSMTRDEGLLIDHCREFLSDYMVPRRIYFLDDLPLNGNRKIDRAALVKIVERAEL